MAANTDQAFWDIANEVIVEETNDLLNKQLDSIVAWREQAKADGDPHDLSAVRRQIRDEIRRDPRRLGPVMDAFVGALWRLLEQDDRL